MEPPSCLIRSWSSLAPTEHVPGWGVLFGWPNRTPCREKRSSALARVCSFPSWPEGPAGWGAWAPGPFVQTTACETVQVWASHRGSWECAHLVLSGGQGPPPRLWWRREATGTARRAGPCTDTPDPRTWIAGMACVAGGSRHESTRPSSRSLQTNLGDGRTQKCISTSTSWTAACEVHGSKLADPRSVVTHHLSWAQWSRGWTTRTPYRLEGPALSFASRTAISARKTGALAALTEVNQMPLNLGGRRANWIA